MNKFIVLFALVFIGSDLFAQQDPQYTQYMYNMLSVNSAYAGTRGQLSVIGLYRNQWVGFEGSPETFNVSIQSPINNSNVGLGINIINDKIGPAQETYLDANFSYTIKMLNNHKLSFGLKAGGRLFNVDWSKGLSKNDDTAFQQNIVDKFFGTIGAGLYYHTEKWYLGLSVPNFLQQEHYSEVQDYVAMEKIHFYGTSGLILDLSNTIKFKPAFFIKMVTGAPISFDVSANFMIHEKLTMGAAYRWDDSVSALVGFQISPKFNIGYAFDYTTSGLQNYNDGSHEIMLRYELIRLDKKLKTPRFF
jgi:type IX secretion system PorP/SprF family membrane protein